MFLETIGRNKYGINSYIVADEASKKALVIDPGVNYDSIMYSLKENKFELQAILLTHGHCDHIADVPKLKSQADVPVYAHVKENEILMRGELNYSKNFGLGLIEFSADQLIKDGQEIDFGWIKFTVIHTPGHTKGGVCYLNGDTMFTGDTLFAGCMGRTDLYGGNEEHMKASLQKLAMMDENINVYPGHGPKSTIKIEKQTNPFLRF